MSKRFCSNCGAEIGYVDFCPSCGMSTDRSGSESSDYTPVVVEPETNPIWILLVVVLVLVFVVFLVFVLSSLFILFL